MTETQVRLFASPQSWMEGEAVRQLYATAKLEGVRLVVGFPDLHPGKGTPVGAAIVTDGAIYPHLIGGDIGCGMALFKTDLVRRGAPLDRWAEKFFHLEHPWDEDIGSFLAEHDLEFTEFDAALGTIGGGNHFAELQAVEEILQAGEFRKLGLDQQQLVVLVHSGSRGLGESVLRAHTDQHFGEGVEADSFAAEEYLRGHDLAVRWARANRELIVRRFAVALGAETERLWDGCHNSITPSPRSSLRKENQNLAKGRREARERAGKDGFHSVPNGLKKEWDGVESVLTVPWQARTSVGSHGAVEAWEEEMSLLTSAATWIHRKGAVATDSEFVVIPGSRGSLSYLVKPMGDGESHAWSLAHGAGRKWGRSEARLRMRERFGRHQLVQTPLGGRVVCEERDLLYEEAPAAYKNIEAVIQDLVDSGLVSVIATFRPLLTYKTRKLHR